MGARTFSGNRGDGHLSREALEQTRVLLAPVGVVRKRVVAGLGFRGVDHEKLSVEIIHRGKHRSLSLAQRRWFNRRQAIEPAISHC